MSEAIDFSAYEEGRYVNYWRFDPTIRRELRRVYTDDEFAWAADRLDRFGDLIGHTVAEHAEYIDSTGPVLESYDRHGAVKNFVRYQAEQFENEQAVYEAGIIADAFESPPGRDEPMPMSHYLGMLYLLSYADPGFACPVAMTAGAAYVLERFGDATTEPYFHALTSRTYDDLIEGAMFLTEEQGGSDVGSTETTAVEDDETGYWRLEGEKWFCSNIDAEGTLALGRTPGSADGTDGLSMFLVPHQDPTWGVLTKGDRNEIEGSLPADRLNDQLYRRLKDKLGTISVPTGEVELTGARSLLVGEEERGFKQMAVMLNVERLSNAAAATGIMGRALLEARIHAANRTAFGQPIDRFPLMREDLVDLTVDHEAATAFTFDAAAAFSEHVTAVREDDAESASEAYRLMRALVPIAKLRTGRMAVDTTSYAMEILGGNGYVRDFVTHRLLRDAQVLPIWEGTENILSLDVLRAFATEASHEVVLDQIDDRLETTEHPVLTDAAVVVRAERDGLAEAIAAIAADSEFAELSAKRLAHYLFDVYTAALLLAEAETALGEGDARLALVATRFVRTYLEDVPSRGIVDGDRLPLEHFASVVHFEPIDPESIIPTPTVDD